MHYGQWRSSQAALREAVRARRRGVEATGQITPEVERAAPLASVIVVCANAEQVLGRCIEQLLVQSHPNCELIVVDDGSRDGTAAIAQAAESRGRLKLVQSKRNRGAPSARNLGLRHARGEIVAFVDADGYVAPDWLAAIVRAFDDPSVGGVASTVFFDKNPLVLNGAGGTVNRQGWAADLSMNESYEHAEVASRAAYPMGCGMAFRREAIERVGAFDDRMLNYYDDVDYGMRVWRAGYSVLVAPDAWVDHDFGGTGTDSPRKRLLCERHRMRVVLKHAPAGALARWALWEARALRAGSRSGRVQKLRSFAWNAWHLPSTLAARRTLRRAPPVPEHLLDHSWGDGFPAGVPPRLLPAPDTAGASVDMENQDGAGQLLHGWFPPERADGRCYRWAGTHAALLINLERPARRMRLDYAHAPGDVGGVDIAIRRVGSPDPLAAAWSTRLDWQYIARSIENYPLDLPAGDYEVVFSVARGWLEPPLQTRSLGFALARISFEQDLEIPEGGLDMSAPAAEAQLVCGWFEAERSDGHDYRWSSRGAAIVVRLAHAARHARLRYRMPPGPSGEMTVTFTALGSERESSSWQIPREDGEWHEQVFPAALPAGDYLVSFDTGLTWSNPEPHDPALPPENRTLGFALAALTFE